MLDVCWPLIFAIMPFDMLYFDENKIVWIQIFSRWRKRFDYGIKKIIRWAQQLLIAHPSPNPIWPGLTLKPVVYLYCCHCSRLLQQCCLIKFFQICSVTGVVSCGSILSSGGQSVLLWWKYVHHLHLPPLYSRFASYCEYRWCSIYYTFYNIVLKVYYTTVSTCVWPFF